MCTSLSEGRVRHPGWLGAGAMLLATTFVALPTGAQEFQLAGPLAGAPAVSSQESGRSSKRDSRLVMPSGHLELAGEVAFLMSQASPRTERLALTDFTSLPGSFRRDRIPPHPALPVFHAT